MAWPSTLTPANTTTDGRSRHKGTEKSEARRSESDPLAGLIPEDWQPDYEALKRNDARHAARAKPYRGRFDLEALDLRLL